MRHVASVVCFDFDYCFWRLEVKKFMVFLMLLPTGNLVANMTEFYDAFDVKETDRYRTRSSCHSAPKPT